MPRILADDTALLARCALPGSAVPCSALACVEGSLWKFRIIMEIRLLACYTRPRQRGPTVFRCSASGLPEGMGVGQEGPLHSYAEKVSKDHASCLLGHHYHYHR